ncbi:TcmO [Amycolatopsis camponoti]|uniref:TcmO n=1 Tax=Amycolatopsis camponoti TaxID=2606593 RepID=A0A6I8LRQ1_9PSEU|nr:tetracenomycin B3 8-O-methyltransferase [Cloning vector pUC57-tcmO-1]VVJ17769.1 TcmO [Amycolatopsis camponoti]
MRPGVTAAEGPPDSAGGILDLIMAFYGSRAVISAVELDLFTTLSGTSMTGTELSGRAGLHPRGAADFLDALVSLGLLERTGDRYANTPDAERHLVAGKPGYVGGYARMAGGMLFPVWGKLTEALRTGRAQVPSDRGIFDGYRDDDATRGFLGAMDAVNGGVGAALAAVFDWSRYSSVVDLGGARGNLAATLVREHPHLDATCFDLPPVERFFDEHTAELGLAGRIRFAAGDFFADPLPVADVFVAGHILHYFDLSGRRTLLARVHESVKPGGAVLVYDRMIDAGRRGRPLSLLGSLNMLLTSPGGAEYTPDEARKWLTEAGFGTVEVARVGSLDTLVIGYKD